MRFGAVGGRVLVGGRGAQAVGPPDGGGVEHEIVLGSRIDRGRVGAFRAAVGELTLGDDFEAGNIGRVAVPFPADESRNAVAVLHAAIGEYPVPLVGTNPVGSTGDREGAARAHQRGFIWSIVL